MPLAESAGAIVSDPPLPGLMTTELSEAALLKARSLIVKAPSNVVVKAAPVTSSLPKITPVFAPGVLPAPTSPARSEDQLVL